MTVPFTRARRLVALALAGAACTAAGAIAGEPTPPTDIATTFPDAKFVLSLPEGGGAWTLWSGTMDHRRWLALASPGARDLVAAPCALPSRPLTVCVRSSRGQRGSVVGRVTKRVASLAVSDGKGHRFRSKRRGTAYIAVAAGRTPDRIVLVARDRHGDVVARRAIDTAPRR
jgi:hypothetical protein